MKRSKKSYQHGFIGLGKMGEAILRGMLQAKLARPGDVIVSRTSKEALKRIRSKLKVAVTTDNREVARLSRHLWLGVKPFQAEAVLREIQGQLTDTTTVISFITGVSSDYLKNFLGKNRSLIRLMPNTPCLLGAGITGVYFGKRVKPALKRSLEKILRSLGSLVVLQKEIEMDAVTGLSGSGPAFVYLAAAGLVQGGIAAGLAPSTARELAYQTLSGASRMLLETGKSPEELIAQVATKGGTTEAGLKILKSGQAAERLADAVQGATTRAREIREENDRCMP